MVRKRLQKDVHSFIAARRMLDVSSRTVAGSHCRRWRRGTHMRRSHLTAAMVAIALGALGIIRDHGVAAQQRAEMHDMQLVGFSDLQARSAYQPVIHKQGDRWIAYIGHHGGSQLNPLTGKQESNGTSILDVTDPKRPRYLAHVPGESGPGEAGGAQMVRVCDGRELPRADMSKVYLLRTFGNSGHEVWDVTDPGHPHTLGSPITSTASTLSVTFSPDGHVVAAGNADGTVALWDVTDPRHPQRAGADFPGPGPLRGDRRLPLQQPGTNHPDHRPGERRLGDRL